MEGDAEQPWDRPREDAGRPEGRSRRPGGSRPEDILTPKQYVNYQHGRILSGLLVFFGCMFAAVGAVQAVAAISNPAADPPVVVWAVFAALGLAGVVGGGGIPGQPGMGAAGVPVRAATAVRVPVRHYHQPPVDERTVAAPGGVRPHPPGPVRVGRTR